MAAARWRAVPDCCQIVPLHSALMLHLALHGSQTDAELLATMQSQVAAAAVGGDGGRGGAVWGAAAAANGARVLRRQWAARHIGIGGCVIRGRGSAQARGASSFTTSAADGVMHDVCACRWPNGASACRQAHHCDSRKHRQAQWRYRMICILALVCESATNFHWRREG